MKPAAWRWHHCVQVRVRYAETDRMGVAWHGNYFAWFEIGRTELLRRAGSSYRELEEQGIGLPVVEVSSRYHCPASYDDLVEVRTRLSEWTRVRVGFEYEVVRPSDGRLLATGVTRHASVNPQGRPVRLPDRFLEVLSGIHSLACSPLPSEVYPS